MKYSTKPYFIRAIYDWCVDNEYSPYLLININKNVVIPSEYHSQESIVINIDPEAVNNLEIKNDIIKFETRFKGIIESVYIPIENILSIYSNETNIGMNFEISREINNETAVDSNDTNKNNIKLRIID